MPLSQAELEEAAVCAEDYPRGCGSVYLALRGDDLCEYDLDTSEGAERALRDRPSLVAFG